MNCFDFFRLKRKLAILHLVEVSFFLPSKVTNREKLKTSTKG